MKRFKHTWFNGMLEDPKGIWVKEEDATQELKDIVSQWKVLHSNFEDEIIIFLLLKYSLTFSILGNIILIYHLN